MKIRRRGTGQSPDRLVTSRRRAELMEPLEPTAQTVAAIRRAEEAAAERCARRRR
jgi:hypothetical protein